jgi:hypothetical protein
MTTNFPLTAPDLVLVDDLDPLGAETTSEAQNLSQDCYHNLIARPGSNLDDINRGVGVDQYLSGTLQSFNALPGIIETDFLKDSRIQNCAAAVVQNADGSYTISVQIVGVVGVLNLLFGYNQASGLTVLNNGLTS